MTSTLNEWDGNQKWAGPVDTIVQVGPDYWTALWHNDHGEQRHLIISIRRANNEIDIAEREPHQLWTGGYNQNGNVYEVHGLERSGRYEFSAILELAA